jgi:hypothetical protein
MGAQGLRAALARIGLPAWFVAIDLLWITKPDALGVDARPYQRAADAWLAGGDPWTVTEGGIPYAAGPHTLVFYVPTHLLPLAWSTWAWMVIGVLATVFVLRRLGLPWFWLLFPPSMHAMWNGNPQTLALACALLAGPVAATVAVALKLYVAFPLLRRWRDLAVAAIVLTVALLVLPWEAYVTGDSGLFSHLASAWNGSAWRFPILLPPTLLALWVLRRRGAEWLAIPAAWPATQFYYSAMALPALVGRPLLAATLALPMVLLPPVAVMAAAVALVWTERTGRPVPPIVPEVMASPPAGASARRGAVAPPLLPGPT